MNQKKVKEIKLTMKLPIITMKTIARYAEQITGPMNSIKSSIGVLTIFKGQTPVSIFP